MLVSSAQKGFRNGWFRLVFSPLLGLFRRSYTGCGGLVSACRMGVLQRVNCIEGLRVFHYACQPCLLDQVFLTGLTGPRMGVQYTGQTSPDGGDGSPFIFFRTVA